MLTTRQPKPSTVEQGLMTNYEIEKLGNCIEEFVMEKNTLKPEVNLRGSKNAVTFFTTGNAVSFPRTT